MPFSPIKLALAANGSFDVPRCSTKSIRRVTAMGRGCVKTRLGRDSGEHYSSACWPGEYLPKNTDASMRSENTFPRKS